MHGQHDFVFAQVAGETEEGVPEDAEEGGQRDAALHVVECADGAWEGVDVGEDGGVDVVDCEEEEGELEELPVAHAEGAL